MSKLNDIINSLKHDGSNPNINKDAIVKALEELKNATVGITIDDDPDVNGLPLDDIKTGDIIYFSASDIIGIAISNEPGSVSILSTTSRGVFLYYYEYDTSNEEWVAVSTDEAYFQGQLHSHFIYDRDDINCIKIISSHADNYLPNELNGMEVGFDGVISIMIVDDDRATTFGVSRIELNATSEKVVYYPLGADESNTMDFVLPFGSYENNNI